MKAFQSETFQVLAYGKTENLDSWQKNSAYYLVLFFITSTEGTEQHFLQQANPFFHEQFHIIV